jgi:hypothetical protein
MSRSKKLTGRDINILFNNQRVRAEKRRRARFSVEGESLGRTLMLAIAKSPKLPQACVRQAKLLAEETVNV